MVYIGSYYYYYYFFNGAPTHKAWVVTCEKGKLFVLFRISISKLQPVWQAQLVPCFCKLSFIATPPCSFGNMVLTAVFKLQRER